MKERRIKDCMHVSFRIANPAVAAMLAERAESSGRSPNLVARELFIEALTRQDETANHLVKLDARTHVMTEKLKQLDTIQRHLERGIYMLFRHAGRLDASQAAAAIERCCSSQPPSHVEAEYAVREKDGPRR